MSSPVVVKNAIARLLLGYTQYNKVLLRSKYYMKGIKVVHASRSFPTAHHIQKVIMSHACATVIPDLRLNISNNLSWNFPRGCFILCGFFSAILISVRYVSFVFCMLQLMFIGNVE